GRRVVWSNANVNENFPGPITPFLASVACEGYSHYFRNLARAFGVPPRQLALMEPHLRQIAGVHGARLYYHLTNIHSVLRFAPGGDALAAYFDRFVGAPADGHDVAIHRGGRFRRALSLLRIAVFTASRYAFLERRVRAFERRADAFARRTHPRALASRSLLELRDDLRAFLDIRFHRWTDAGLADVAAMVCYGVLEQLLHRAFPDPAQRTLHNTLLKGLSDLASSAPVEALWELSRQVRADAALRQAFAEHGGAELLAVVRSGRFPAFEAALAAYLERHGFRGSGELMLTVPSFQEDPTGLLDLLARYAEVEGPSPSERLHQQGREREEATARIRAALAARGRIPGFHLGQVVALALRWTQAAVAFRERARTKQALLYTRLRRLALATGAKLAEGGVLPDAEAVFFLTHRELDQVLSGQAPGLDVQELVRARRAEHETQSALEPPDRLALPEGEAWSRQSSPAAERREAPGGALTGSGTCGGQVTARSVVLLDLSAPDQLAAGDILVTRQTDPGWAPVFFLIKGLVMERGGMLSHGSILAREFGLPSVVGIRDATARIRSGQTITVDGDLGHVLLCDG
ncbi:MAG TPA: PEP-utilizing enzyme, partial [Myxococcales bacterium]|nr:PEP-utilizing enzyme [Myxococcales bacterium]